MAVKFHSIILAINHVLIYKLISITPWMYASALQVISVVVREVNHLPDPSPSPEAAEINQKPTHMVMYKVLVAQ